MSSPLFAGSRRPVAHAALAVSAGQSSRATLQTAFIAAVAFAVASGVFVYTRTAYAGIGDIFLLGIAWIFQVFAGWVGTLLLIVINDGLIYIAQYNGFVTSAPVVNGWGLVRDVTNMFFILVLLVIAFGTILGVDAYSYKNKMLSRLLIMAVVVNFSRTICGLLIDFAQVVMLTFVYGFREAAGGNFVDAFRITSFMQAREISDNEPSVSVFSIAVASILAFFMILIALVVVILMTITLAIRIVYLWLLVVLSPIAFFLKAVPGGSASGYYGMWWKMFTGQVIVGPVMAFFLWLALVSVASGNLSTNGFQPRGANNESISGPLTEGFRGTEIQAFIISICLLMGGLQLSKQISSESAGAAPGIAKKAASLGMGAVKGAYRGGKAVGGAGISLADKASGGRVGQARDWALTKATKVPLVRGVAADKLAQTRTEKAKKAKANDQLMAALNPDARQNMANAAAWTSDQKLRKESALNSRMKDAAAKPPTDEKGRQEFFDNRKALRAVGKSLGKENLDAANKTISEVERKNPKLIIDPNEKDPAERQRQNDSFRKAARSVNANKLLEMDPDSLDKQFLAFANPKAMIEATKNASGDQLEKLQSLGKTEGEIIKNQNRLKGEPANFGIGSETDRIAAASGMDKKQLEALALNKDVSAASLGGGVLKELATKGVLSDPTNGVADKVAGVLDAAKLRGDDGKPTDIANAVAAGISASALARLPENIGNILRPIVGETNAAKALAGGANMGQVFPAYGDNGNFPDAGSRADFDKFVKEGNVGAIPKDAIAKNGGMNDVALSVVNNVTLGDVKNMIASGSNDQAAAIMDLSDKLAAMAGSSDQALQEQIDTSGLSSSLDDIKSSIKNAKEMVEQIKQQTDPMKADLRQQQTENKIAAAEERSASRLEGAERRITGKKRGKPRT